MAPGRSTPVGQGGGLTVKPGSRGLDPPALRSMSVAATSGSGPESRVGETRSVRYVVASERGAAEGGATDHDASTRAPYARKPGKRGESSQAHAERGVGAGRGRVNCVVRRA